MFGDSIAKRVNAVMKKRIADAEKDYKEGCDVIEREAYTKKGELADECVRKIIGN